MNRRRRYIADIAAAHFTLSLLAALANAGSNDTNFRCADAGLASAAEQARIESARFWSGGDLPGSWSSPCPIHIQPAHHSGGGATSFQFDRGEVSGWSMSISGRRAALLRDVIPHEVDHMVRASLVRRPIPRWLDEGCATLMESAESHRALREQLHQHLDTPLTADFLDAADYPREIAQLGRLYAVGFSVVEFLISQKGAEPLLQFQCDARRPSEKLMDHYGLDVSALDSEWRRWAVARCDTGEDCTVARCLRHALPPVGVAPQSARLSPATRPRLTVYTSPSCGPCRQFWSDLGGDPGFRASLEQEFQIVAIDIDRLPLVGRQEQIDSVPTFVTPTRRAIGYEGKAWLLESLRPTIEPAPVIEPSLPATTVVEPDLDSALSVPDGSSTAGDLAATETSSSLQASVSADAAADALSPGLELTLQIATHVWPWLEMLGVVGGSAATGGVGAIAVAAALGLLRRRRSRGKLRTRPSFAEPPEVEGGGLRGPVPFPRRLDEARQLLELRQSEGRVAVLDALRGMFLDDELQNSLSTADASEAAVLNRLQAAIDTRVSEVAPLSTSIDT